MASSGKVSVRGVLGGEDGEGEDDPDDNDGDDGRGDETCGVIVLFLLR